MRFHYAGAPPITLPDDYEIAEYIGDQVVHLPQVQVTAIAPGDIAAFPAPMAADSPLFRVLSKKEIAAHTKDGVIESRALAGPDPVTGLTGEEQAEATRKGKPIPQLAAQTDADGEPIPHTVATDG